MKWMTIRATARYIKQKDELVMISESTIRTLIGIGFPCVRIGNRVLINVDTFFDDLIKHSDRSSDYPEKRPVVVRI